MRNIKLLEENSAYIGELPMGCILCGPGKKMVLLITGKCQCRCFYCPLSKKKRGKDVGYANELKLRQLDEMLAEAEAISAGGTGITGGDPLIRPERTLQAIKMLKSTFGEKHHIHLYTAGKFDFKYIEELVNAGLDEIRFHPNNRQWKRLDNDFRQLLKTALASDLSVGSEIPVLPGYKDQIINYARSIDSLGVEFLNLNELEFSESNWEKLSAHGYSQKNEIANTVMGSEDLAVEILKELANDPNFNMNVHYCSASFKDRQQLTNRLKRRAKNVKKHYHLLTDDGTFLIGLVEPVVDGELRTLVDVEEMLIKHYLVPNNFLKLDREGVRLELAAWVLDELKDDLRSKFKIKCYIIEVYPTSDRLEVERIPIDKL